MRNVKIPLLKDHHSHILAYAALQNAVSIHDAKTKDEAAAVIARSGGALRVATGWNNSRYVFSENDLKTLPPVIICNSSFHSFLASPSAMEFIPEQDLPVVRRFNDQDWVEKNLSRIFSMVSRLTPFNQNDLAGFMQSLALKGVWYAEEMLVPDPSAIDYIGSRFAERTALWASFEIYRGLKPEHRKIIRGIKLFADGALGARTAALKMPYHGGGSGMLLYGAGELEKEINRAEAAGLAIAVHAIGEIAIVRVLEAADSLFRSGIRPGVRIEHAQFITPEQARKAKSLGITLSMQPNFSADSVTYSDRLPPDYPRRNNPFRMLIDEAKFVPGKDLIFGSDGMPHGAQCALQQSLFPPFETQRLSLEEFTAGYCLPDERRGLIEAEINEQQRSVKVRVKLSENTAG